MFFEVFLSPQSIIVEADDEEDFKIIMKNMSVKNFIFDYKEISKKAINIELEKRFVYIDFDKKSMKQI